MARALPSRVVGIDFSGAADAGRKIWIAEGGVAGDKLHLETCASAADRFQCAPKKDDTYPALRKFLRSLRPAIVACDFPFSLPKELIPEPDWPGFLRSFADKYPCPQDLFDSAHSGIGEPYRQCDDDAKTPFSPVNLRLFRQTYHGIRDVLKPLVTDNQACALPLQSPRTAIVWMLECCPASALKKLELYKPPYKGRKAEQLLQRGSIIDGLTTQGLAPLTPELRRIIESQHGGDALDSVVAAWIAYRVAAGHEPLLPRTLDWPAIEGYVYSGFPREG